MDTKEKDYDADAVMAKLRESLKKIQAPAESITIPPAANDTIIFNNMNDYNYGISAQDTITITSPGCNNSVYNNTVIGGGYSVGGFTLAGAGTTGTYTVNSGAGAPFGNVTTSTKIQLEGEDADIEINGKSLAKTIQALEERLNILVPNFELEKEWDELKELGDKYRALEAKFKEQSKMWEKLKEMPPPKPLC